MFHGKSRILAVVLALMLVFAALPAALAESGEKELTTITSVLLIDTNTQNRSLNAIGETIQNNRWNDLIAETYGYKIEYSWIASDQEEYDQKFNASLAAGNIPDIIRLDGPTGKVKLGQCVEAGLLAEMGPLIEEHQSDLLKSILEQGGDAPAISCTIGGKQWALPVVDADIERGGVLWLRTDWLEKAGKQPPKTIDELIDIMKAFKEIGGDGTVGMTIEKDPFGFNANHKINLFCYGYGAYPDMWIEKDGKLVYGQTQPEMKAALTKLNEMYKEGLLDTEFIVKDGTKCNETVAAGQTGVLYGAHWTSLSPLQDNVNNFAEADWYPYDLPSADGAPTIVGTEMATSTWFCASSKCPNPEIVVQLANLYCDKTFDPEKQEYAYYSNPGADAEGIWKLSPVFMMTPLKNIDTTRAIRPHLESGDPGELYGEQKQMWQYTLDGMKGDRLMWGWTRVFGIDGSCQVQDEQQLTPGETLLSQYFGPPTESMNTYKSIIDSAYDEAVLKMITGEMPLDEFDNVVAAWHAGGGQAITDEVNAWYAESKQA